MNNVYSNTANFGLMLMMRNPSAVAYIKGSPAYPDIVGIAMFYPTLYGVVVTVEAAGLPAAAGKCAQKIFAFHIHEGGNCTGNEKDPFADTGGHYNPDNCPHPFHAGDLPPLFGNNGYAWSSVLTDRITIDEIIGKTVIIHSMPDDFRTQPSGDSGEKIACGVIIGGGQAKQDHSK